MNFKSIIGCVCVCSCLPHTIASATTVWSTDMFINGGSEWKLYVVTTEDALGPVMTPTALYIDNVSFGAHAIDPMMLLTNPVEDIIAEAFTAGDFWDIITGFSFAPSPLLPTFSFSYFADILDLDPDGNEVLVDAFDLSVSGEMLQMAAPLGE